ncbi:MAG: hypothetical protein K1X67_15285 [Fimbriimonadaceae bacterium]|nr:hypothetical protein [Fimbriimonadaceae bacterium]
MNSSQYDRRPQIMQDLDVRYWGCVPRGILEALESSRRQPDVRVLMTILIHTIGHEYQSPYALRFPKDEWNQYREFRSTHLGEVCSNEHNVLLATHIAKHLKLNRSQLTRSLKKWKDQGIIDFRDGRIYLTSGTTRKERTSGNPQPQHTSVQQGKSKGAYKTTSTGGDADSHLVNNDVNGKINSKVDNRSAGGARLVDVSDRPSLFTEEDEDKNNVCECVSGVPTHPRSHPDALEDHPPELLVLKSTLESLLVEQLGQSPDRNILCKIADALGGAPIEMLSKRVLKRLKKIESYGLVVDLAKDCNRDRHAWERAATNPAPQRKKNLKAEAFARRQLDNRGEE